MNYRQGPLGVFADNFSIGLREILAQAITLPRTTTGEEYKEHFDEERFLEMRRYYRGYDNHRAEEREEKYPELLDDLSDDEMNARWGQLSGKHAGVRWLAKEDRSAAEDFFPSLDL